MKELLVPLDVETEDVVLVNDVSASMFSPDFPPTRLDGAKQAGMTFLEHRAQHHPHDQLAIVAYSTSAWIMLPFTPVTRQVLIRKQINSLRPSHYTNVGAGLAEAERLFLESRHAAGKRIILYSDGCHNAGPAPQSIAARLKGQGVAIFTVGIGGTPSEVDEPLLKQIASTIDGEVCYRFISDVESMVAHYQQLAESRLVRWEG